MAKKLISRRIFYCWFGGKEKPQIVIDCINSWKQHNPTWEIVEINESNFPVDEFPFAKEAIIRKRYAFATDVARLWAIYTYGGVYCDSDFFIVKPLDRFLESHAFTGCETDNLWVTAIMGSVQGHSWIKKLLGYYINRPYSETTNTNIITQLSKPLLERENKFGYKFLRDDVVIHPHATFCNFDHKKFEVIPHKDAYGYHLFSGSWCRSDSQDVNLTKQRLRPLLEQDKSIKI